MEVSELERIVKTLKIGQLIEVTERLGDRDAERDSRFQNTDGTVSKRASYSGYFGGVYGRKENPDHGIHLAHYINPDTRRSVLGSGVVSARHIESIKPVYPKSQ